MAINHEMNYYNYGKTLSAEGIMPVLPQNGKQWPEHEYVDLGLPSGTLWATDDIKNESGETLFFSWGETVGNTDKDYFTLQNYKFYICEDEICEFPEVTKYNETDGKTVLEPVDDAATANWGPDWCMPTSAQVQELISTIPYSKSEGIYSFSGENGSTLNFEQKGDGYNTSVLDDSGFESQQQYIISFPDSSSTVSIESSGRSFGLQIRPVRKQ